MIQVARRFCDGEKMNRKLQVFVSSTYQDLIEERQAAVSAILKAGHIPAGMELFTAGSISQMKTIENWINESDIYMLILGGRYGSIEPTTGLSYTELEYDYAVSTGKPLFAVVINEDALEEKIKRLGTSYTEKENPKELAAFRKKALQNISSFFSDHKDVRLCVFESLPDLASNADLKGWVSGKEIEDAKQLYDRINVLNEENTILKEKLAKVENNTISIRKSSNEEFEELLDVLSLIEVDVPAKANNGEEGVNNLFDIMYKVKDILISGVVNTPSISDLRKFIYYNIIPKLQMHGLADTEKVAGVMYRRAYLTKKGQDFLSYFERQLVLNKKAKKEKVALVVEDVSTKEPKK